MKPLPMYKRKNASSNNPATFFSTLTRLNSAKTAIYFYDFFFNVIYLSVFETDAWFIIPLKILERFFFKTFFELVG